MRHLAAEEAVRRGLAKDSDQGERSAKQEEELRDALFASIRDSQKLSEEDLRAHWEKNKLTYTARQLVLRRKAFASEADARAEDRRLGSEGRIPADGAETLGPAPVEALPDTVLPEILSLSRPGQRIAILRRGRWSLVEIEEVRIESLPFEAVRPRVERSLRLLRAQAEYRAELQELRSRAQVELAGP